MILCSEHGNNYCSITLSVGFKPCMFLYSFSSLTYFMNRMLKINDTLKLVQCVISQGDVNIAPFSLSPSQLELHGVCMNEL